VRRLGAMTDSARCRRWLSLPLTCLLVLSFYPSNTTAQYRFDRWTTDNGLPNNWIEAICQTRDGYLWLTTPDGVARFDGVRFRVFNKVNTPSIITNKFSYRALWEDRAGTLWMGTVDGGVIRYRDGVFTSLTTRDGLPSNHVLRIDEDAAGIVWITTTSGIVRWKGGHLIPADASLTVNLGPPKNILVDVSFLGLWRATPRGWQRFAYGEWTALPLPPEFHDPSNLQIASMAEDSQHRLWYCVQNRPHNYYQVSEGRLTVLRGAPRTPETQVCCQDREGRLWMSNHDGKVGFWKDDRFTPLPGIETSNILQVLEDREGNLWIATLDHGLYRLKRQVVIMIRRPGSLEPNLIGPMIQDRNGVVWMRSGGFSRFQEGRFKTFFRLGHSHSSWDWANWFSTLYEDRDGSLWMGTWDGAIVRFQNRSLHEDRSLSSQIKGRVYGIVRDLAGDMWFGGDQGLYRLHKDHLTHYAVGSDPTEGGVSVLHEDRQGTLWIGTRAGLFRYTGRNFSPINGLRGSYITTLLEDSAGILWVGTHDDGLDRLARGPHGLELTRYTTEQGLYSNRADQIVEDDLGFLWMSCDLGLYRVHKQELNDFAAGRVSRISSTRFGEADGLGAQLNSDAQPMAFKAADGRLWFSTQDGIAVVDPSAVRVSSIAPTVKIEECAVEGRPVSCRSPLEMKPGQSNLEITYTALSFIEPEADRFRYRLEGWDRDWIEAGARRTAYYSHLPTGDYVFHVLAASSGEVWNLKGESLRVAVLPPFYRSWWFLALLLCSAAAMMAFAWRYRTSQLKHAHAVQQAFSHQLIASQEVERKRIAAELHDSLGQHLVIIRNLALLALNNGSSNGKARAQMEEVSAEASQALSEVREISYNLRPYQLDRIGLTKAIGAIVKKASTASNVAFTLDLDDIDNLLPHDSEINLYRIVQECINNVMKHSQATQATVAVRHASGELLLVIQDDGKGFVSSTADLAPAKGGFGLIGISERAQLLGGRLVVNSGIGQGTTLNIRIPLGDKHA
jgi:signal transduction histidine kinase/streptogramin lyase